MNERLVEEQLREQAEKLASKLGIPEERRPAELEKIKTILRSAALTRTIAECDGLDFTRAPRLGALPDIRGQAEFQPPTFNRR